MNNSIRQGVKSGARSGNGLKKVCCVTDEWAMPKRINMKSHLSGHDRISRGWWNIGRGALVVCVLVLAYVISAWGEVFSPSALEPPASSRYQPVSHLKGALTIVVDPSLRPHLLKMGNEFQRYYPDMKVVVQDTSVAPPGLEIDAFLKNFAEIRRGNGFVKGPSGSMRIKVLALSRGLTADEIEECVSRFGYRPVSIAIGKDALAIYVNRANPVQGLTLDQLQAVFAQSSEENGIGPIAEWGLVGGEADWTTFPINVYGVNGSQKGIRHVFDQLVLAHKGWNPSLTKLAGPASMALAIGNDTFGIGFGPLGFTMPQIRAIPIAKKAGMPLIMPSARTVMNGTYPLSQSLFLHINKAPHEELPPFLAEFLKYLHSQEGHFLCKSLKLQETCKFCN
jgi:phosphate transport system substrate-binding protein